MIEIIMHEVKMPELSKRRFQKECSMNLKKWVCIDTCYGDIVKRGSYEDVSLACHNLNKKFYDTKS